MLDIVAMSSGGCWRSHYKWKDLSRNFIIGLRLVTFIKDLREGFISNVVR